MLINLQSMFALIFASCYMKMGSSRAQADTAKEVIKAAVWIIKQFLF